MPIKFHCEHCGKSISAPDDAGGRKGRCPSCKEAVYVPLPEAEELGLAPIDEEAERKRQRLIEDSLRREHDLLLAQGRREDANAADHGPTEQGGLPQPGPDDSASDASPGVRELIVRYLTHMATGQLEQADAVVKQLRADPRSVRAAIERFLGDPVPDPRIATVPQPVLNGFVRQLQQSIR